MKNKIFICLALMFLFVSPSFAEELEVLQKTDYNIYKDRHVAHVQAKAAIAGVALTDQWTQLQINTTAFNIHTLGGFSLDAPNYRIYWDSPEVIGKALPAMFVGDAGVQVTAGISGPITITMSLRVNGVSIIETPLTFIQTDKIQGYGSNSPLLDVGGVTLLQPGSYFEVWAKAGTGETPTITLTSLTLTVKRD